jgi:meso-butanediol dehydrogenase / (S,S)-butanediol dehydrogenase / diacetyl reductase
MDLGLSKSVVLITGCAGLKARAIGVGFAREGAIIVGCDIDSAGARETVAAVEEVGGTMDAASPLDISDPDKARRWVTDAYERHSRIDILCNCANAIHDFGTIDQSTAEAWAASMRSELMVAYSASQPSARGLS